MNSKNNGTLKGHHQTLKESKSSVLGDMIGQRHLETVEVEWGGEVEFETGVGGGGRPFKAAERFYSDIHPTCYDM